MCSSEAPLSMNKRRRRRARKSTLSKPRKPKILSLHRQILPNEMPPAADYRQLDLFPLQPETDRESQDQAENVALFFSAADGGATTLTGLLDNDNSSAVDSNSSQSNNSSRVDYMTLSPASLTYSYGEERAALVRTALRSRDRESSDEKWVRYSEVVERKVKEEVTSSAVDRWPAAVQRVLLKLDYDEIINAWSDKGPLFVDADSSQIVPDVKDCFLSHHPTDYEVSGWGCNSWVWRVPENENEEEMKNNMVGERKASLLRYKEKRQNRLFSKKIRYQVRKLNAEKRPRLKGRFVKKS